IGENQYYGIIDTGSPVCVINSEVASKLKLKPAEDNDLKIKGVGGKEVKVTATLKVSFSLLNLNSRKIPDNYKFLIASISVPVILGTNYLVNHKAMIKPSISLIDLEVRGCRKQIHIENDKKLKNLKVIMKKIRRIAPRSVMSVQVEIVGGQRLNGHEVLIEMYPESQLPPGIFVTKCLNR